MRSIQGFGYPLVNRQSFPLWRLAEPCAMRMTEGPIWNLGCHRRILREVKCKLRPEGCEGTEYGKRKVARIQARGNSLVESPEGKGIGVSKKWKEGQCIWRAVCLECSEKSRRMDKGRRGRKVEKKMVYTPSVVGCGEVFRFDSMYKGNYWQF